MSEWLETPIDFDLPILTKQQRQEMLELERTGLLPEKIRRNSDLYFKFLFGRESRTALLLDLLNCIFATLGYPRLKEVALTHTELVPESFGRKKAIVDIRGIDENERQLSIELQRESQPEFIPRCLFYWGKNYVQQLGAGRTYKDLKATVLISLLCFSLYTEKDNEKSVWDFILTNPQTGRILTEDELLIFVELEKFTQAMRKLHKEKKGIDHALLTEKERLLLWGSYINNVEEGVDLMDNLAREDSVFKEVQSAEKTYWSAPENRYLQLQEEIADLDYRTGILNAEMKGEKRGIDIGMRENQTQTAREMKAEGLPIPLIARITKLSEEKIRLL